MKRAVSISIGSSKRNKTIEIELLGEKVLLERIGTDGDMHKAADLYHQLDGRVDAFGVGGTVLGLLVDETWYPLRSVQFLVAGVHKTPVVDGTGLKTTLERRAARELERQLGERIPGKRALLISGVDRYGLSHSFIEAGYDCVIGDLMFAAGVPAAIRSEEQLKRLARVLIPVMGLLPFSWLYPTGENQEKHTPKWTRYFDWASVITGDCHYITRYMPDRLENKVIVTNTTTPEDRQVFRQAGVKYLMTTTPVLEGRSFGTNMMEAGIVAALGRKEPVDYGHAQEYFHQLDRLIDELQINPSVQEL